MKMKIFRQLDPRENRLPRDTSNIVQSKPHRTVPLVNPDLFVSNHPGIKKLLASGKPTNPTEIRADFKAKLHQMVDTANAMIRNSVHYKSIHFSVDEDSGRYVAVVKDSKSGRTLRQIPNEQVLSMAARLKDNAGLFKDITI